MDYKDILAKIWQIVQTVASVLFAVVVLLAVVSTTGGAETGFHATLLAIVGGSVLAGAIVSSVFEKFGWFQELTSDQRLRVISATVTGMPILAWLALTFFPEAWWPAIESIWPMIVSIALSWLGSQAWHSMMNRRAANGKP
jgi:hypothetical protein